MLFQTATIELDETRLDQDRYEIARVWLNTHDNRIPIDIDPPMVIERVAPGRYQLRWRTMTYPAQYYQDSARALATLVIFPHVHHAAKQELAGGRYPAPILPKLHPAPKRVEPKTDENDVIEAMLDALDAEDQA